MNFFFGFFLFLALGFGFTVTLLIQAIRDQSFPMEGHRAAFK